MRKAFKQVAEDHATHGTTKLLAKQRFERAELGAEYRSLYAFLSSETHNNTSAFITRHITQDEVGKWVLDLYSGRAGYSHAALLAVAEMLMHASDEMHDRFGKGRQRVASITAAVEQARADVRASAS